MEFTEEEKMLCKLDNQLYLKQKKSAIRVMYFETIEKNEHEKF